MGRSHSLHIKTLNTNGCPPLSSEQGHLTRFLSYGLGLSVTAIEANRTLVAMASKFDGQLVWALEKENQKKVGLALLHHSIDSLACQKLYDNRL